MVAKNDITGDSIQTKGVTDAYRDNYDIIFNKKKKTDAEKFDEQVIMKEEYYDQDLEEYKRQAQEMWNDSCTSQRKK
jgi:DNA/RNA endonuclease YhcR with UshA esterase domain